MKTFATSTATNASQVSAKTANNASVEKMTFPVIGALGASLPTVQHVASGTMDMTMMAAEFVGATLKIHYSCLFESLI